jgi:hypothetical protein
LLPALHSFVGNEVSVDFTLVGPAATKRSISRFFRENAGTESATMTSKIFVLGLSVLLLAGTAATGFAQSQRNYGPNGPATGDTFGEPYSGTAAARRGDDLPYTGHGYYLRWHHPHYWHYRYGYR